MIRMGSSTTEVLLVIIMHIVKARTFEVVYCCIRAGRRRVAVAQYRMICLILVLSVCLSVCLLST